jgi:3-hydroxyacyl-[acyl-carrier-protein] dehydratase
MAEAAIKVTDSVGPIDVMGIMASIPHRYPMLMVDRIEKIVPGEGAIGIKNVSINEQYFAGHFPSRPVLPGVLLIEAMAQTAAVYVVRTLNEAAAGKLVYLMSVDEAKFRRPVVPGDQVKIHVQVTHNRRNVYKFKGEIRVDGDLCAECRFSAMVMDD